MDKAQPSIIGGMAKDLWSVWTTMFGAMWPMLLKVISFMLWVAAALIILPCVFIAAQVYPLWEEWGAKF